MIEAKAKVLAIDENIRVVAVAADLLHDESIEALWKTVEKRFGHANVLTNNAGAINSGYGADVRVDYWVKVPHFQMMKRTC